MWNVKWLYRGAEPAGSCLVHVGQDAGNRCRRAGAARQDRRRLAQSRAGRGGDRARARDAPLRDRRAHRLSPASHGGGAAGDHGTGLPSAELLLRAGHQGGAARRRHLALRRGAAARRRRAARHGQVQPHPGHRLRQPGGGGRARRHQSRGFHRGRQRGLLLRPRPVLADRLHHWRQHRREFRRRALPEIRHDHQQCARLRNGADERRGAAHRRQASGQRWLRPARHHHRLRGAARRGHRSHRAHPQKTRDRARAARRLPVIGGRRRMRLPHHRRRHHPRRHGDDGQAGDQSGGGIRPRRLSARRRGAIDRRTRWAGGGSRSSDRARRDRSRANATPANAASPIRKTSGCCSGPGARRRFRRSAASRRTITAWTAPFRAPSCRWCCVA